MSCIHCGAGGPMSSEVCYCAEDSAGDWFDAAPIGEAPRCADCGDPLTTDHRFSCVVDRHEETIVR